MRWADGERESEERMGERGAGEERGESGEGARRRAPTAARLVGGWRGGRELRRRQRETEENKEEPQGRGGDGVV